MEQNPNRDSGGVQDQDNPVFDKKVIEQPIFDAPLRSRLRQGEAYAASASGSQGLAGFYKANKLYFWAIGAGAVMIAALSYLAFGRNPQQAPAEADIAFSFVNTQQAVASGGEVVYRVKIENKDKSKLVGQQLEMVYPSGFSYISSSPEADNLSGTIFDIPDLIPGQNVVLTIKAKATGAVNEEKKTLARLRYKFENFSSEFVKEQDFSIRITASDILMELAGPATTNNAQLVVYSLNYQNNSGDEVKNARIRISYPEGFSFASASPAPDADNNIWTIASLPKGGFGEIQVQGSFKSAAPGQSKTAIAEFLILGTGGQYFPQSTASFTTAVGSLPLLVSQELELAGFSEQGVVKPGDTLRFVVRYQNNAATAASGVNILASLDSKALDMSSIRSEGAQVSGNTILWNASTDSKLELLSPNEGGKLAFTVRVKDPATRDSSKNLSIVSSVKIKSNEYETFFPGNELVLKVSSPASASSLLSHLSGSLPPQVGKSTVYKVKILLANSSNDLSEGVLTAFLPQGGGFVEGSFNVPEAGKAQYDSSTGKLSWSVGRLLAHTGKFSQPRILEFSVRITPSSGQANQSVTLVKDIKFSAKDSFTEQEVAVSAEDVTTADLDGEFGFSQGQVQP